MRKNQTIDARQSVAKETKKLLDDIPHYDTFTDDYVKGLQPRNSTNNYENEIVEMLKLSQAPTVDLDVFDGNVVEFPYFLTTFKQVVEEKVPDERGRLSRLIKYTKGEAHELVKSCVYLSQEICYERAKELLTQKYGSPFKISSEYRKQLANWPKLKANDAVAFNRFESFLLKYQSAMLMVGKSHECSVELLQLLQCKLPTYLQNRWSRIVFQIRRNTKKEATFEDFLKLVNEESTIIGDPLFSRDAVGEVLKSSPASETKPRLRTFRTTLQEGICVKCKQRSHSLDDCKEFSEMDPDSQKKFIFIHRLCFSCLKQISQTHTAKTCTSKLSCKTCAKKHPTSIHKMSTQSREPGLKSLAANVKQSVSLSIVAVRLRHSSNLQRYVTTLALLDNGSKEHSSVKTF